MSSYTSICLDYVQQQLKNYLFVLVNPCGDKNDLPGPEVIKLSRVRTYTPNRTTCSELYSYSRSRSYKSFFVLVFILKWSINRQFLE